MASEVSTERLDAAVRAALQSAGEPRSSQPTARTVRHAVEQSLGLPEDALVGRKDELMSLIEAALAKDGLSTQVDPLLVKEAVSALEDMDG